MTELQQNNALGLATAGLSYEAGAPRQTLHARLDIFSESIVLTRYDDGTPQSTYEVAPESIASAFSGVPMATGILPEGCIYYAKDPEEHLAIFIPAHRRKLWVTGLLEDDKPTLFHIPLPPLVFRGRGKTYSIYAVKERPTSKHAQLYNAPFPNVHANGGICSGSVRFPECSPETIHDAAELFFRSEFNQDLADGKSLNVEGSVIALWNELDGDGVEEYPLDDLVRYRTIRHLWGDNRW
jgi:PRTRC genetic system protein B